MGGSLSEEEVRNIKQHERYRNIKYFIESGTYKGDTTFIASKFYEKVITIELHENLYRETVEKARQKNIENITFLLGDSVDLFENISKFIGDNGAVFFLDAHISGFDSTWNNKQRVPIYEEINNILKSRIGPSIFIIDDVRLWKNTPEAWDWKHITNDGILQHFINHGYKIIDSYEKDDRFYIFI